MMMRLFIFLTFSLMAVTAQAACRGVDYRNHLPSAVETRLSQQMAATPFSTGNHWIARKGRQTLHIIGTMHGGDSRMARIMRTLRPVIASADAVYFEVHSDPNGRLDLDLKGHGKHTLLPTGQTLRSVMSRDGWVQFRTWATIVGLDLTVVERLQPWMITTFIIQNGCRPFGLGIRRGLDDRIEQFARRKRIPIAGLETVEIGLQSLARVPLRDQARLLENDLALLLSEAPDDATPVEAYFDQSTWQAFLLQPWIAQQYSKYSAAENQRLHASLNKSVLDWRNKIWMGPISQITAETAVIAVGAAHLPGKSGILNLLKKRGYHLEAAPF